MLILFDIDSTLLTTGGAGIRAMGGAGRGLYGEAFDERRVEYAGRLDPLIIADLLASHGISPTLVAMSSFRAAYREHLEALLGEAEIANPCPGVSSLLGDLSAREGLTLGLLTGNFPETGAIKLRAGGIDPEMFTITAWGCDSPHDPPAREHLPPVAMSRYHEAFGRALDPAEVTIIGDTPHDVSCGKAHGCRVLGVGTGLFTAAELSGAGADLAVETLEGVEEISGWLVGG